MTDFARCLKLLETLFANTRRRQLIMGVCLIFLVGTAFALPQWIESRFKDLIEIARSTTGAAQIANLYRSPEDIPGLNQVIDAAWSGSNNLSAHPTVRAINDREIEIAYLVVPSTDISMYANMFSNPDFLRAASHDALERLCSTPPSAVLAQFNYKFSFKFWNAMMQSYGPLTLNLADCVRVGPFSTPH